MKINIWVLMVLCDSSTAGFWWLNQTGAFGGMNYDTEDVVNGKHIRAGSVFTGGNSTNSSRTVREATEDHLRKSRNLDHEEMDQFSESRNLDNEKILLADFSPVVSRTKRQSSRRTRLMTIPFKEIVTQCPTGNFCIEREFCELGKISSLQDLIPCLDQDKGKFGVCCNTEADKVCPRVVVVPSRVDCALTKDECDTSGQQSTCGSRMLCCNNGCARKCYDPYYRPLNPAFRRTTFREVGRRVKVPTTPTPRPTTARGRRPPSPTRGGGRDIPTTTRFIEPTTSPSSNNGGNDDFDIDDYDLSIFSRTGGRGLGNL